MLIYQPIEEIISVLYHCNTLTTNKHHSSESHMVNQSSSQAIFQGRLKLLSVIHTNIKHHGKKMQ